ncbi:DNA polymerase III subunit chi [Cereibacter sphaeroides]|uniref:DNA polymerase III subunit chi n=1 Tax=Rhodobacterales TaxID=204455 RepID=UPI000BBED8C4|nr:MULTISPECIES: DNA polymerase III subunit chi [Paracoccaceae]MCE6952836.1 DNA polymerase III subunit chi [Cereibacter sphaeroides]MCE6962066.1 DNA polymerase III subunit chi [Cereibacter sphaeroides]MCE6970841.1 DNA polymerase III subunit chi [Cereibacter sphaeroides]MCE6975563.1 DNA polymerase III subunit chi [Cereibacter sphaeroides]
MGVVMFYHLTRSPAEETLRLLLPRALSQGWRVMLRGTDRLRLEALDLALWREPEDGFLPHGLEGGPHDAVQPVLLGTGGIGNGAQALMLLDGADTTPEEARPLERVWILFDALDEAQLLRARGQWKALTAAGLPAQYWSEDSGRWEKKAEVG